MRQIFENDLYFGGRNMILLGDFHQLPPVLQQPLFRDVGSLRDPRDKAGRMAYEQFTSLLSSRLLSDSLVMTKLAFEMPSVVSGTTVLRAHTGKLFVCEFRQLYLSMRFDVLMMLYASIITGAR